MAHWQLSSTTTGTVAALLVATVAALTDAAAGPGATVVTAAIEVLEPYKCVVFVVELDNCAACYLDSKSSATAGAAVADAVSSGVVNAVVITNAESVLLGKALPLMREFCETVALLRSVLRAATTNLLLMTIFANGWYAL